MNIISVIRDNRFTKHAYQMLSKIIFIAPFYLTKEYLATGDNRVDRPNFENIEIFFLDENDIWQISQNSEVPESYNVLLDRIKIGCQCLGLRCNGQIAAYTWFNPQKITFAKLNILLDHDEAYLFDARTFKAYRGMNIAPFLRAELYNKLAAMGRTKFVSTTSALNVSAIKFKKKLGARKYKLYLHCLIFSKYHCNILLKSYEIEPAANHLIKR